VENQDIYMHIFKLVMLSFGALATISFFLIKYIISVLSKNAEKAGDRIALEFREVRIDLTQVKDSIVVLNTTMAGVMANNSNFREILKHQEGETLRLRDNMHSIRSDIQRTHGKLHNEILQLKKECS